MNVETAVTSLTIGLLALSLVSGAFARRITRLFAIHSGIINRAGGILLVAAGLYDQWVNWELIAAALG